MKHIEKKIDKYDEKDKKVTITNKLNLRISQFYQEDNGTIWASSKSMKIKDDDIIYEMFNKGIVFKNRKSTTRNIWCHI